MAVLVPIMTAEGYRRLGPPDAVVRLVPGADLRSAGLTAAEGFVLSRVDGKSSLQTICLLTGMGEDQTLTMLLGLQQKNLIVVGDDEPATPVEPTTPPRVFGGGLGAVDTLVDPTPALEEQSTASEGEWKDSDTDEECELKPELRKEVGALHARLGELNIFDLLGVPPQAEIKEIRKGFFSMSKLYHPDRYFGKKLGPYSGMLHEIFKQMNAGYKLLCDQSSREEYRRMVLHQLEQERLTRQMEQMEQDPESLERAESAGEYQITGKAGDETPRRQRRTSTFRVHRAKALMDLVGQRKPTPTNTPAVPPPPVDPERQNRRQTDHRIRADRVTGALFSRAKKAVQFYTQGKQQLERGQYLAATASLKLASTYNPEEKEYAALFQIAASRSGELTSENYYKCGMMEESVGRFDAAAVSFEKAARQNPKPRYLAKAAEAMLWSHNSGDLIKAKDYVTKAVQADPNSVDVCLVAAKVYKAAGMKRNARRELQQALKIEPNNQEARELLKRI